MEGERVVFRKPSCQLPPPVVKMKMLDCVSAQILKFSGAAVSGAGTHYLLDNTVTDRLCVHSES